MARKLILGILGGLCFFLAIALSLVLVLATHPQWILREPLLRWGAGQARKAGGPRIEWREASVMTVSHSLLLRRFQVVFDGLCVELEEPRAKGCFEHALVSATVDFSKLRPRLRELGPIAFLGGELDADLERSRARADAPSPSRTRKEAEGPVLPKWIRDAAIPSLRVELRRAEVRAAGRRILGKASAILTSPRGEPARGELSTEARAGSGKTMERAQARLNLSSPERLTGFAGITFSLTATGAGAGRMAELSSEGRWSGSELSTRSRFVASGMLPGFGKISSVDCAATLGRKGALRARCPVRVVLPVPPRGLKPFQLPTLTGAVVEAELASVFSERGPKGTLSLELEPVAAPLFRGEGHGRMEIDGEPRRTEFAVKLTVPSFQKLERALRGSSWAVPAPFHVLGGSLVLDAHGTWDERRKAVPLALETWLSSPRQRIRVRGEGEFRMERPHLDLDVDLADVRLQLPRLDLSEPPKIIADQRIEGGIPSPEAGEARKAPSAKAKAEAPGMTYSIRLRTSQPVQLSSNLARTPIPVRANLRIDHDKPPSGTVDVEAFRAELFRREAGIDHVRIELNDPPKESKLEGKVRFEYADYLIDVFLLGTVGDPRVLLRSEPPLPEDQLVAALLFGAPLDTLDPDQINSVGSARAALTDGALSLASLYVLSSTPIQSISYDPASGIVSAKIRLAEGTSLNLGTGTDRYQEIGIRKRLGPHWTITTELVRPAEEREHRVSAFLEWALRY